MEPVVVAFASNAARKIAGPARYPVRITIANANPVGGQIGLALGLIEARDRPSLASAKYATATAKNSAARRQKSSTASAVLRRSTSDLTANSPHLDREQEQ